MNSTQAGKHWADIIRFTHKQNLVFKSREWETTAQQGQSNITYLHGNRVLESTNSSWSLIVSEVIRAKRSLRLREQAEY